MRLPLVLLFAATMPLTLAAQRKESLLRPGARVRFIVVDSVNSMPGDPHYVYPAGVITSMDAREVVLRADSTKLNTVHTGDTMHVPTSHISFAESFTGMRHYTLGGAIAGGLVGALVGFQAGNAGNKGTTCTVIGGSTFCSKNKDPGDKRGATAALGGAAGALVGGVIGHFARSERWTKLDVASLKVQLGLR